MAVYPSKGMPPDTLGTTDDFAIDYVGRFLWGPKTTTWAGTATSIVGPTGTGFLFGLGPPTSAIGSFNDAYMDLQSGLTYGPKPASGQWGPASGSLIGPAGPAGTPSSRCTVFMGGYWNTAYAANALVQTQHVVQSGTTVGLTPATYPVSRAGSIVGWGFNQVGPVGGTFSFTIQKNNVTIYTATNIGSGAKPFSGVMPASMYPFVAGDFLNVLFSSTAAGNLQGIAYLDVQTNG